MTTLEAKISEIISEENEAGYYPIHELACMFGQEVVHQAIMSLWKNRMVRLIPISDYRDATQDEIEMSIQGVEEILFYVKKI